ncbi:MAG: hypothetical protein PW844_23560 [Pantoea sp.]|uniref:hypothetical protein n=1 Tax=Pantoea sp. TaxID=69393 RepID=UPI00238DD6F1|nr:hypothetical protein [Pantoea sp.]MDE1189405.1 hypothetical protein [Pantoea sp.]
MFAINNIPIPEAKLSRDDKASAAQVVDNISSISNAEAGMQTGSDQSIKEGASLSHMLEDNGITTEQFNQFLFALYDKSREHDICSHGQVKIPAGSVFIIPAEQVPSTRKLSSRDYFTCLRQQLSFFSGINTLPFENSPFSPVKGKMITAKLELRGGGPVIFERAHMFYLHGFRPSDVRKFMATFFQVILAAYNKGNVVEKATTSASFAGMNDAWALSENAPEFANNMKLRAFLNLRDDLLKGEEFAEMKAQMKEISS